MTLPIALTLGFLGIAGILRVTGRLRSDLTALILLMLLGVAQLIPTPALFSGFGRSAVVLIIAVYMLAAGLEQTGAIRLLADAGLRVAVGSERRIIVGVMSLAALLSLGLNTVVVVTLLLPGVLTIAQKSHLSPKRVLIPLAFGALLGGTATLFTTANILASAALVDNGLPALTILDFFPAGALIALSGIAFMAVFGPYLLPSAPQPVRMPADANRPLAELYGMNNQITALYVKPQSRLAGVTLADGGWGRQLGLTVIGLSRGGVIHLAPPPEEVVRIGDVVLSVGHLDPTTMERFGLFPTEDPDWPMRLASRNVNLVEVLPAPRSSVLGKTLSEINFREKYALNVLAIWREGTTLQDGLADRQLQLGDALLLQGRRDRIAALRHDPDFLILDEETGATPVTWRTWAALTLAVAALILPATGILPIAEATFAAAALMILLGCTTIERAYAAVDWKTVFTIAAIVPISLALTGTGTAAWLSEQVTAAVGPLDGAAVGVTYFLLAVTLTQMVGGRVVAIVLAPIAIASGIALGSDPRLLSIVVAWGCSTAFLTPGAHSANRLVMGPGGYHAGDFLRVGAPLTLVVFGVVMLYLLRFSGYAI